MAEHFEILDCLGISQQKTMLRSEVHQCGAWHHASHVHLINLSRQSIFIQKRCATKDVCPNMLDVVVGGHHDPGEPEQDAANREVREEIGVDLLTYPGERILIKGYKIGINEYPAQNVQDHELRDVTFFLSELRLSDFVLQREEVFGVLEFAVNDILDLFMDRVETIRNIEGACFDAEGKMVPFVESWRANDFVPSADNYFGKVAFYSKLIFQGERAFPGI
ncbi:hypothetical protein A9Q99_10950 [Gammaproteobacteria bacterium 45_16_T64]|nr:hypothetical protein A9Q99_10950 [Gammaproteobacteria bacterium 45_16_T64]